MKKINDPDLLLDAMIFIAIVIVSLILTVIILIPDLIGSMYV
jgi:hypothetical protein